MPKPRADVLLARHWLTHPDEPAYQAAKHMGLETRTVQKAAERLRATVGTTEAGLLKHVLGNPIRPPRAATLRVPDAARWLQRTRRSFLLSGEDAAVIDGWSIVPHRHLVYVDEETFRPAIDELLDEGARLAQGDDANLTIRVRDPWLTEEPRALVERGQRLVDYMTSQNVQFLIQLREKLPGVEP